MRVTRAEDISGLRASPDPAGAGSSTDRECDAEFEGDSIRERTKDGLEAARARGRKGYQRPTSSVPARLTVRGSCTQRIKNTVEEIMKMTGFKSRATFYT